tara:strand:+ start:403 stop:1071 length:669 start_codon:yes stop_codon:yes gene_type:complete
MIRFFDLLFSSIAILFLMPIFLIVIPILKITGEGEVFYLQERVGKDGNSFRLIKFCTMLKNSESIGTGTLTIKNDPRVLPFGKFLRGTKINELPQLFNIIFGHMSIIGPRPQTDESFDKFPPHLKNDLKKMKPGLSGIGSIFFSNEESILNEHQDPLIFYKDHIAPFKAELEIWYKENNNLILYFLLILFTIFVMAGYPRTKLYSIFSELPEIPESLREILK